MWEKTQYYYSIQNTGTGPEPWNGVYNQCGRKPSTTIPYRRLVFTLQYYSFVQYPKINYIKILRMPKQGAAIVRIEHMVIHLHRAGPLLFNLCKSQEGQRFSVLHSRMHQFRAVMWSHVSSSARHHTFPASHHNPRETDPSALLGGILSDQTSASTCCVYVCVPRSCTR
ncbi:hypothetical protein GDO81_016479 [Engystomops pustulosus]|uniref:Uncharacterized protein n=1 Tax=Engystomops pustulosus TaxID=76066 RepID=A0AAV7AT97_ENGPU|nr:hypothetical protein GDO81_016479 [Engystomops pustulosus]